VKPSDESTVSIGLAVYNEEHFLRQTLESLLAQDYQNLELVISDNASTDGTSRICQEFVNLDRRVRYERNTTNLGCIKNFNQALALSTGKYFMWAGGHDLWDPSFVARAVSQLEADPEVILVYPRVMLIDRAGTELGVTSDILDTRGLTPVQRYLKLIWDLQSCNMFHGLTRTQELRNWGLLRNVWGADIVLLGEFSLRGSFAQIPEVLFFRREVRPEVDQNPQNWKQRALETMEGAHRSQKREKSLEDLFREMRNEELKVIRHSTLNWPDKLRAFLETIYCARLRYAVRLPGDFFFRLAITMRTPRLFVRKLALRIKRPLRAHQSDSRT